MVNQDFSVDLKKPLAFQVANLGVEYDKWVHQSIVNNESPRLFENDAAEFTGKLTCDVFNMQHFLFRPPWWAIPLVWLPVVCLFVSSSINKGIPHNHLAPTFVSGILLWTFLEYLFHRFVFHMEMTNYWGIIIHFVIHGAHHKHPMDVRGLVFPPALTSIALLPIWNLTKTLMPAQYANALIGGLLLGYIAYDCTHYYLHHGKPFKGLFRNLKTYHMLHHFKILDKGYGVTTTFWDRVFGTLPRTK